MRWLVLGMALACSAPGGAAAQAVDGVLEWPIPAPGLDAVGPVAVDQPAPRFEEVYAAAWVWWPLGLAVGAVTGLGAALPLRSACPRDESFGAAVCPSLTILTSVYAGAAAGALLASASGAWSMVDGRLGDGEGWVTFLGALLLPALGVALGAGIAAALDERQASAGALTTLPIASALLPQLGAALFHELSRLE